MRAQSTRFLPSNPASVQLYLRRKLNWRVDPTWHEASTIDFYWNMSHRYWNCFWFTAPAGLFPLRTLRSGFDVISVALLSQSELRRTQSQINHLTQELQEETFTVYSSDICKIKWRLGSSEKALLLKEKKNNWTNNLNKLNSDDIYGPYVTMSFWIFYEIRLFIWNVKTSLIQKFIHNPNNFTSSPFDIGILVDFPISIYFKHKLILKVSFLNYGHDRR